MTPERKAEIRDLTRARWVPPDVVMELLAEVDRLEALITSLADVASAAVLELPGATAADAEQVWCAVKDASPLDSPPAKR